MCILETISEIGVSQHCKIITRPISGKILDIMLTNRPDTVVDVSVFPGISDHNVIIGTFNLITSRTRKPQRKILKFNQTDWTEVRKAAADVTTAYMARQPNNHTVQENGTFIETHLLILILILILILYSPITIQEFFLQNESHRFLN